MVARDIMTSKVLVLAEDDQALHAVITEDGFFKIGN